MVTYQMVSLFTHFCRIRDGGDAGRCLLQQSIQGPPCVNYTQYPWGYAVPVRTCSTCESYLQYMWGYVVHVRICGTRKGNFIHSSFIWIYSWVLHMLLGTGDMTHGYCISSQLLQIWITDNLGYESRYCISSRVLQIWLMGTDYMTYGCCIYTILQSKMRRWLGAPPSPDNFWITNLTPTNYISLER